MHKLAIIVSTKVGDEGIKVDGYIMVYTGVKVRTM